MPLGELIYVKKSESRKIEGYMDTVVITTANKKVVYPDNASHSVFYSKSALRMGHEFH